MAQYGRLRLRGMGATFREEAELNISALQGPLVAICGENGAGKSVALECLAGAIDRTTPTRGRLGDLATSRDSMVEVDVQDYTIRHTMDAVSGAGESLVMRAGEPIEELKSGKRKAFDKWAAKTFPPTNVRMASTFGAQKSEGFIDLKGAGRKDVILSVKGCDHLQAMSSDAGALASEVSRQLAEVDARIDTIARRDVTLPANVAPLDVIKAQSSPRHTVTLQVEGLRARATELEAEVEKLERVRTDLTSRLEAARVAHATHATVMERHETRRRKRRELDDRIRTKREELRITRERIANNEEVMAEAAKIRAAATMVRELEEKRSKLAEQNARVGAELRTRRSRVAEIRNDWTDTMAQRDRAEQNAATDVEMERELGAKAAERRKQIPEERAAAEKARKEADEHHAEEARLARLILNGKDDRIAELRATLRSIADNVWDDPRTHAAGALAADDAAAKEAEEAPHRQAEASRAHRDALTRENEHNVSVRNLERLVEQYGRDIDQNAERLKRHLKEEEEARAKLAELTAELKKAEAGLAAEEEALTTNTAEQRRITDELERAQATARHAQQLDRAEARLEELRPRVQPLEEEIAAASAELTELGPPEDPPAPPENAMDIQQAIGRAEADARAATESLSALRHKLASREEDLATLTELEMVRKDTEADLADWRLLQKDLGRDGLQALEVDAAGPELTTLANDLLHNCLGPRFSVRIDTSYRSSDGKKDIEDCLVNVTDTEKGHDGEIREFSGGERGLIGEAIDLALTMMSVQSSGLERPTLVRDERGAALSPENERAYLGMLRRAAARIGAPHVLFVAHSPAIQALADTRVHIEDGQFHIR